MDGRCGCTDTAVGQHTGGETPTLGVSSPAIIGGGKAGDRRPEAAGNSPEPPVVACSKGPYLGPCDEDPAPLASGLGCLLPTGLIAAGAAALVALAEPAVASLGQNPAIVPLGADSGVSWGSVGITVVGWAITTVLTWVISGRVATARLENSDANLTKKVDDLSEKIDELSRNMSAFTMQFSTALAQEAAARTACELRCTRTYVTTEQWSKLYGEIVSGQRVQMDRLDQIAKDFHESIGNAHARMDKLADITARLDERTIA